MARTTDTPPVAGNAEVLGAIRTTACDIHDLLASMESLTGQAQEGKAAARVPVLTWSRALVRLEDIKGRVRTVLDGVVMGRRSGGG